MTKPELIDKMIGVTVPVATLFTAEGKIDVPAMKKLLTRMVTLGTIDGECQFNVFFDGSSGNLANNTPEIGGELVRLGIETLQELGVKDALVIAGARGRSVERVLQYIRAGYKAGARIFVVPHPKYKVFEGGEIDPELIDKETGRVNYAKYIRRIIDEAKKEGMDDIYLIAYDIAGACEDNEHIAYEDIGVISKFPEVLGLKVSAEDRLRYARYSQEHRDGEFVVEDGFLPLEGAFTGGEVSDKDGTIVKINRAHAGVLIDGNIFPELFADFSQ